MAGSPMRDIATVRTVQAGVFRKPVSIAGVGSGWVAETAARHKRGGLYFGGFEVGRLYEHTLRRTVTQMDNMLFSALTYNCAPLHIDYEYCKSTIFGKPLINSMFIFALVNGVIGGMMKSGEFERIYNKWYTQPIPPKNINIKLPMNQQLRDNVKALSDKPAPAFALPVLHDPEMIVHSDELRGAPYLFNVWGSWCAACREEHPVLTRFAESKRVRVIVAVKKD